jgi:hypothetical protein
MSDPWKNLTASQLKILSISEKLAKMEGVFTGWYYVALMTHNNDAATVASDLRREASIAQKQLNELVNEEQG